VFKVNTDSTGFTALHSFTALSASDPYTNSDGYQPAAGLILSGNILYGTAFEGGSSDFGTVFGISTDGTGFTNLHSFDYNSISNGAYPLCALALSENVFFGTTQAGGSHSLGTVFKVNIDGSSFTNLHDFNGSDGESPTAGLILCGNTLFGTTTYGGSSNYGTVFKINTDGMGFNLLHTFVSRGDSSRSDGAYPYGELVLSGNILYGTTREGGYNYGTVFKVNTNGTGFTNLYSFTNGNDGGGPQAGLAVSGKMLYGTATQRGAWGNGTVFAVDTDGTAFTVLHAFTALSNFRDSDGTHPHAGLFLAGRTLYGTAYGGGSSDRGTVFSLSFAPSLTISPSGTNVVLMWPSNYVGFDYAGFVLQSAPVINGTFTNILGATSPYTNSLPATQRFFRLVSN